MICCLGISVQVQAAKNKISVQVQAAKNKISVKVNGSEKAVLEKMDNMKVILQFAQKIDIIEKTIAHKVGKICLYVNW